MHYLLVDMSLKDTIAAVSIAVGTGIIDGVEIKRVVKGESSLAEVVIIGTGSVAVLKAGGSLAEQSDLLSDHVHIKGTGPQPRYVPKPNRFYYIPWGIGAIAGFFGYKA